MMLLVYTSGVTWGTNCVQKLWVNKPLNLERLFFVLRGALARRRIRGLTV
jgi:hypothetical protein